ncbi:hypothetical protein [Streptomyces sp. NPDC006012]|uniref:hypothetical protein n=1 Tax=Streptomyces sp. NPDC006012 TaxID=3364739 RepID=UPI003686CFDF
MKSSLTDLVESFSWASWRAREWVQTGRRADFLPSYWAGLTDRPMFYSRDLAHQMLGAHLLGLDAENLAMLRHFAASATERRGWYPLWAFTFDGVPAAIDYHDDDDFVREIPAPFELVEKAVEQYRWTGDERFLRTPEIAAFIRTTLTSFAQAHDPLGTGVAGERGSGDIFQGTATYNEVEHPPHLLVAADGIASQWAAHAALAEVAADAALDPEFTDWNAERKAALEAEFADGWWLAEHEHYTAGFTHDGPVSGFGLESTWFPAVKGVMRPDDRATAHLDHLSACLEQSPPHNIEAFTYLPEAYLRYGRDEEALRWIRFLAESRADYPEVPFTHVAHIVTGLTGLSMGSRRGEVHTRAHIPPNDWLEADGIAAGRSTIGVRHEGHEASELWVTGGNGVTWTSTWPDGRTTRVDVPAGGRARVSADGGTAVSPRQR